jgi:hypothetical protein
MFPQNPQHKKAPFLYGILINPPQKHKRSISGIQTLDHRFQTEEGLKITSDDTKAMEGLRLIPDAEKSRA